MSLAPAELAAAREFRRQRRAALAAQNAASPPGITVSVYVRHVRHECPGQGGKSVSLELREHYELSPGWRAGGPASFIPAGRFAFIWTGGRCPACGMTARSGSGRLVDPAARPPAARAEVSGS